MKNKESGVYTVEFAIVGSLFFLLFFAALEIARLMFTWTVLTEVSRRGARLASVCNILTSPNSSPDLIGAASGVSDIASFKDEGILPNLTASNIKVSYLQIDGATAEFFNQVELVRVEIANYQHQLLIPGLFMTLNSPAFSTTIPRESLGVSPHAYTDC